MNQRWLRIGRYSLLACALLLSLASGGISAQSSTPVPTTTAEPQLRDETLLQDTSLIEPDDSCAPPCWRGITPGETSWDDALAILENDPTIENVEIQVDDQSGGSVASFQQVGGTDCCQLFTQEGETVSVIFVRVAPSMSLGQLIAVHGIPKYLIGSPFLDDQAVMNLIYPGKALVVYAFTAGQQGWLSETSEIVAALYMEPMDMDLLIKTSYLHLWHGYQRFSTYENSRFEVTPSVTLTPTPVNRQNSVLDPETVVQ